MICDMSLDMLACLLFVRLGIEAVTVYHANKHAVLRADWKRRSPFLLQIQPKCLLCPWAVNIALASLQSCFCRLWKRRRVFLWSRTLPRKPASRSSVSSATTYALPA